MITVPDSLATLLRRDGENTERWIAHFPELAEQTLHDWRCQIDGPITTGAVAVIIPARSPYGPAVIKMSPPHPENAHEHVALRAWNGVGAVQLYDSTGNLDTDGFALLLERVEDRRLDVAVDDGIAIGGELSAQLAVPAPPEAQRLADTTAAWEQQLHDDRRESGSSVSERAFDAAVQTIRDLGRDTTTTLLHGDLHGGNILHSARGWVAIDPKGMYGPRAFDSFTMCIYRWPFDSNIDPVAEARRRITIFSRAAEADHELSLRCAHARAVTGVLWDLARGGADAATGPDPRVALAERLLE